jgi:ABC-type branched-subunit amino acid transport system permease subunit
MLLSGDPPRSRVLTLVLVVIILALAATPFLFPGAKALNVAAKICVFAALVASYDLLLGYTGSVSFAHTMFYGIASTRNFAIATSPKMKEPRSEVGSGIGTICGPHSAYIVCSATIRPPVVIRICFRCWP